MKLNLVALFVLAPLCVRAAAQETRPAASLEEWSSVLLDSPALFSDDRDARAAELLALIERSPEHPLVELGLRLLRNFAVDRPAPFLERCLALNGAKMTPSARGELSALQRLRAAQLATLDAPPRDDSSFDRLAPTLAIGPLPDSYDTAAKAALLDAPGFEREHRGYPGKSERWITPRTSRYALYVDPDELLDAEHGWGVVAFSARAARGGPGWIELDFGGDSGPSWTTTRASNERGALSQIDDPSVDVRINDEAPVHVDFLERERPLVVRLPTLVHSGANRVLVAVNLGARVSFCVRVLAADGSPYPGLARLPTMEALGERPTAQPPSTPIETALTWLESIEGRSARATALLGAAHLWLGESTLGAHLLENALAADSSLNGAKLWLAEFYNGETFAPQAWARGKSRKLMEELTAADPTLVRAATALADTLSAEDREEEALTMLRAVADVAPDSPQQPLNLIRIFGRLDLEVPAERALLEAAARAPESPRALNALAQHWANLGFEVRASVERDRALAAGSSLFALGAAAQSRAELGDVTAALELRRRAANLGGEEELQALADYLQSLGRYEQAAEIFTRLAEQRADSSYYLGRLADLAHLSGDKPGELRYLEAALALSPSDLAMRDRARNLGWSDDAHAFFEAWKIDTAKELETFDPARWEDHVVRAIDAAAVWVFEDGTWTQISHSRSIARDLEGCESLGSQSAQEEMLRIATIKSNGAEFEPVLVDGEYVMPALEPGDTVETVWRRSGEADREGRLELDSWSFASIDEPFHLSRYVISLPKSLGLELVLRNFSGEHQTIDGGERVTHVFELRDVARVVPERLGPPPMWYLPWLQFGMQRSRASMAEQARLELAASLRVTPQLAEVARRAVEGLTGQEQQARALHAFTAAALDNRNSALRSATAALLQREGSPAVLYAALLRAVGIEHDLVWSRGVDPRADQEPDPAFPDLDRWLGRLLVVVQPNDGPQAWCNLGVKTMPYGEVIQDSARAEALSALTGRFLQTPDVAIEEQTGERTKLVLKLKPDRSAAIEFEFEPTGNVGYLWKEGLREAPKAQIKQLATRIATTILRGMEVEEHTWPGLDDDSDLRLVARGAHRRMLDEQKGEFTCPLPFPALQMGGLASGDGERKRTFLLSQSLVRQWSARIELDPKLKLVQGVEDVELDFGAARFRQTLRPDGENAFVIERSLLSPPLRIEPDAFPQFVVFCKKLDDLDRAKLRFQRVE